MIYYVRVDGCKIVAVVEGGTQSASNEWIRVETKIPQIQLFTEYVYIGGSFIHVGPAPQGLPYVFDKVAMKWVVDFESVKREKTISLKQQRDSAEFGHFTYNGMVFDGDVDAQRRLSGVVSAAKSAIAAGQTFTKEFTLADNSVVQLTAEDFVGIEMAKIWQVDVAFQEYRLKKAAIEAATTLEELEAVTI